MRKTLIFIVTVLLIAFAQGAFADAEVVTASFGTMSLSGNLQVGYNWYIGNESYGRGPNGESQAVEGPSDMEFYLKRVRLVWKGQVIDEKVKYFVQLENAKQTGVELADIKLGFKYIPYTTVWVGRFLPHFMHWTNKHTGRLYLIDYPLSYRYFGIQRHTGIDIDFNHQYIDITLSVTNGHNYNNMAASLMPAGRVDSNGNALDTLGPQTWGDENTAKDIYFRVDGKPIKDMNISAAVWYGSPLDYFENDQGDKIEHNATAMAINGAFVYNPEWGLRLAGEVLYSTLSYDSQILDANGDLVDRDDDTYELKGLSYYARAGYNIETVSGVPFEFLIQYDHLNPDLEDDEEIHGYQDEETNITAAVNYYLMDYHAMIYLNYIHKIETREDVLNLAGDDTQTGLNNDEVKILWQIAF